MAGDSRADMPRLSHPPRFWVVLPADGASWANPKNRANRRWRWRAYHCCLIRSRVRLARVASIVWSPKVWAWMAPTCAPCPHWDGFASGGRPDLKHARYRPEKTPRIRTALARFRRAIPYSQSNKKIEIWRDVWVARRDDGAHALTAALTA